MKPKTIQDLSSNQRHQECLQACQKLLQSEPENSLPWKYAGKSLLALDEHDKAQRYLIKAHEIDTSDPEIAKEIGNIYLKTGNRSEAAKWYQKALEADINYAPAICNLANISQQNDNHEEAIQLFNRAIQKDPKLLQGYAGAATSLLKIGDCSQAESLAIHALKINKYAPGFNEILGIIYQAQNQLFPAIDSYTKELSINPKAYASLLNIGLLYLQLGRASEAAESLKIAGSIKPSEKCSLLLAQAYQSMGEFNEAIAEYKKIDICKSYDKTAAYNLGLCLMSTNNNIDAIEAFKIAAKSDESFLPAWGMLSTSLINEGRYQEAQPIMQKILELDPENPTGHMNMGSIYKDLGNLDQALTSTIKSLELKPDNPTALMNMGSIYKDLGNLDQALTSTIKSLELKPDNPTALMNLGVIHKNLGKLEEALTSTLKSLELSPNNATALMNLGGIYKNLGNLDQALASTLQSLELKPDNPTTLTNLSGIYQDLGNLDKALAYALKSLEVKPDSAKALYILGTIKVAQGVPEEAKKYFTNAIENEPQEYGAYFELSKLLETTEEVEKLSKLINSSITTETTPTKKSLIEFTVANCMHKAGKYDQASEHLQLANANKLIAFPSNVKSLRQEINNSLSEFYDMRAENVEENSGNERIFIVGMPRSGSTLLETILSINPEIKDLGESRSLEKAIAIARLQKQKDINQLNIAELYTQLEPVDTTQYKYTTDKNLYNFKHINYIMAYMPGARIIHCHRNPLDNIISMYRGNLMVGNNYTASIEDATNILIAQEQAMRIQKKRHPNQIFSFSYDQFVNAPANNLRKLLEWLDIEFNESYLQPEKSTRNINTASAMEARSPISNKSLGTWKNYKQLLKPALAILEKNQIIIS